MKHSKNSDFGKPDDENPEWKKRDFARAVTFGKLKEREQKVIMSSVRGRPAGTAKKEAVTISLDKELVAKLRASGAGWQTRVNDALRAIVNITER